MARSISKVAKELAINIETVRFYERRGLIEQPSRPVTGYRHYPRETVDRIRFIKRTQELGFTLNEISHLLSLDDKSCGHIQHLAERKIVTVRQKIKDLRCLEQVLNTLLVQCRSNTDNSHCPIIDSLQR